MIPNTLLDHCLAAQFRELTTGGTGFPDDDIAIGVTVFGQVDAFEYRGPGVPFENEILRAVS
jgi:hypothetical protein